MNTDYYRDIYKRRGTWWGANTKEQYINISKKYFEDYLLSSPNADTIILDGTSITVAIHENRQDDSRVSKYFLIGLENNISTGQLIQWNQEYWLVVRKEKRTIESYHKVLALRCNYNLKWIDDYGIIIETPTYMFGHMEQKINESFGQFRGTYVAEGNKNLELILPFTRIPDQQRFIIKNEAWRAVEKDLTSIDGILYMTLVEDNVNKFADSELENVANINQLGNSYIDLGMTTLSIAVDETFTFSPVLYKDGKVISDAIFTYSLNNIKSQIINSTITGKIVGQSILTVNLVGTQLTANCTINIIETVINKNILQIVGDEKVKWGKTRTYTVIYTNGTTPVELEATFEIIGNDNNLISIANSDTTSLTIIANSNGKTGQIILRANTVHGIIEKEIAIVSLW